MWDVRTGADMTLRQKAARITGEVFSHRDLSSITDYCVPHMVTD